MILDTNAVSALLVGETALVELLSGTARHELPVIVIGEYRFGLLRSTRRSTVEPAFERLIEVSRVLSIDEATTRYYAQTREDLRRIGRPIPENDVWIAALARQHELAVVSRDKHFDAVAGMVRLAW